jgi:hypothetical protein
VIRRRPPHRLNSEVRHLEPHSNVHVLRNEEELQEALRRSARFDQSILDKHQARADRYKALMASAPVTEIRPTRRPSAISSIVDQEPVDEQPTSA